MDVLEDEEAATEDIMAKNKFNLYWEVHNKSQTFGRATSNMAYIDIKYEKCIYTHKEINIEYMHNIHNPLYLCF